MKTNCITRCVFIMIMLQFVTFRIQAREWFVSLEGNDSNSGTVASPLASIHKACLVAQAGDTVIIRAGVYYITEQVRPQHSGIPGKWIVYRAMDGEKVIIDGSRLQYVKRDGKQIAISHLHEGLVQLENVSYIKCQNITVQNSYAAGFILRGGSNITFNPSHKSQASKIILERCASHRSYNSGIGVWYADSVQVTHCEVTGANELDYRVEGVKAGSEAPHEAISVCGARYFEIDNNHVHHCHKEGIDCKEVSRYGKVYDNRVHDLPRQAYYVDAWFGLLEDIELYGNVAYNCFWGFGISVEGENAELRNVRFHHNLIYKMTASGVLFGMWGRNNLRSDIYIYNNTFYRCGSPDVYSGGVGSIDILSQNFKDVYIYRNICDKGWDYEFGFNEESDSISKRLQNKNFVAKENLVESVKNRQSRKGQFDALLIEFLPEGNTIGNVLYRDENNFDFVPERAPKVLRKNVNWKYTPSDWYGALKPINQF